MQRQTVVISRILLGWAASAFVAQSTGALTQVTGIALKSTAGKGIFGMESLFKGTSLRFAQ